MKKYYIKWNLKRSNAIYKEIKKIISKKSIIELNNKVGSKGIYIKYFIYKKYVFIIFHKNSPSPKEEFSIINFKLNNG